MLTYILLSGVVLALFAYLMLALFKPEWFS